jgi:transposase
MEVTAHQERDVIDLRRAVRREKKAKQRDRCRAVLLALEGRTTLQIVERVGRSRPFVQKWVYRYRDEGLVGLAERARSGQPTKLRREDEAAFRRRLEAGPREGDGVCTLRGRDAQRILVQEFGATYSLNGVYDLLHRLGYSCLKPRPVHRKNDPQIMAQWVTDAPLFSTMSPRGIPGDRYRSGSRTKPASDRRAR